MLFEQENNLYRNGWIDLVFANRNQQYGAYVLRKEYPQRMAKALSLTVLLAGALVLSPYVYSKWHADSVADDRPVIEKTDPEVIHVNIAHPPAAPPKAAHAKAVHAAKPQQPPAMRMPVPVPLDQVKPVNEKPVAQLPVENPEPVEVPGDPNGVPTAAAGTGPGGTANGSGDGTAANENELYDMGVEKSPEFPGGQAALANFIRKNMRYPSQAVDNDVTGRVVLNFVVERDGSISNVRLVRGIGFGCDEEAIRVVKRIPGWIPGEQNGRKVRVLFTLPLAFNLQR